MADYRDDKDTYREVGVTPYEIDDKYGRSDSRDRAATGSMTVSGSLDLLPLSPLGRRNYIKVINVGGVIVEIFNSTVSGVVGFPITASGGEWEDNTDATFYIKSTGATSEVRVYERSQRFNYKDI